MSQEAALKAMFDAIGGAGDLNDFERMKEGEHVFAIRGAEFKDTREHGTAIIVKMVVMQSTAHRAGEEIEDAFFINMAGDSGKYAKKRARAYALAVIAGLGREPIDANVPTLWQQLMDPRGLARGILVKCKTAMRERGKKSAKPGEKVLNNTYEPVAGQSAETIAAARAKMDQHQASAAAALAATAAAAPPPPVQPAPPPPVTTAPPISAAGPQAGGFDLASLFGK